jgi:urocanate hydratase
MSLIANAADIYPELVRRGVIPDMVTNQTSVHNALNGYIPADLSLEEANELRARNPQAYSQRSLQSMGVYVRAFIA